MQTVREFLSSVWYAREEIERLSMRIKEMESQAMKVTSNLSGMPRSGNADAQALWARIADDTDKLYATQAAYYDHIKKVEAFIDLLPLDKYKAVLKLRYLECLGWPDVAEYLGRAGHYYEIRQVFRLHGAALESARLIWETESENYV